MTTNNKQDAEKMQHAISNGQGWAESIEELYDRWEAAEGDEEEEALRESTEIEVWEGPLSIEYRSEWVSCREWGPGEDPENSPAKCEYRILLSTGGPALQITGRFPDFCSNWVNDWEYQVQDWLTPWTKFAGVRHGPAREKQRTAITWYIEMQIGCEF